MRYGKHFTVSTLFFGLIIMSITISTLAQQTPANDSWLDRPFVNWNRQAGSLPELPQPSAAQGESAMTNRCRAQVRQPATAAERALVRRGWMLYGPVQSYEMTNIVTALSGFDGMCRPLGFQAFVYWEGRYAGTLSPLLMNSRTNDSLTGIHLISATSIMADFVRYTESDALCCPSRTSSVLYDLRRDDIPTLTPKSVTHRATCPTSQPGNPGPDGTMASLFKKKWALIQIRERRFDAGEPYIEFDREQVRFSGSSGCNRFTGIFEMDGAILRLSRIASTKRACLDADAQQVETDLLQLLESTTRFEVQGKTLRLYVNEDVVLVFGVVEGNGMGQS
jgi:heat shock protein HslJ